MFGIIHYRRCTENGKNWEFRTGNSISSYTTSNGGSKQTCSCWGGSLAVVHIVQVTSFAAQSFALRATNSAIIFLQNTACKPLVWWLFFCQLLSNALATLAKWRQSSTSRHLIDIGLHSATLFLVLLLLLFHYIYHTDWTDKVVIMTFRRGQ